MKPVSVLSNYSGSVPHYTLAFSALRVFAISDRNYFWSAIVMLLGMVPFVINLVRTSAGYRVDGIDLRLHHQYHMAVTKIVYYGPPVNQCNAVSPTYLDAYVQKM